MLTTAPMVTPKERTTWSDLRKNLRAVVNMLIKKIKLHNSYAVIAIAICFFMCYINLYNNKTEVVHMLKQKALTKQLTATLCTTTNTLFIHNNKTVQKAANVYTANSKKVIHNLTVQQQTAFNSLQNTFMQKAKNFVVNTLAMQTLLK